MKQYELMIIVRPQVVGEDNRQPLKEIEKLVTVQKGKIVETDEWGEKTMSYAIDGHERGYYIVYQIEIDPKQIKILREKLRLQKDVMRYILLEAE